jgi:hypothetical protein
MESGNLDGGYRHRRSANLHKIQARFHFLRSILAMAAWSYLRCGAARWWRASVKSARRLNSSIHMPTKK